MYTVAVLHNSASILKCLQKFEIPAKNYGPMNALDFAICLNRRECFEILSSTFQPKLTNLETFSPLLEIQRFQDEGSAAVRRVQSRNFSFKEIGNQDMSQYLEEMIRAGHDVNYEETTGVTALQLAIYRSDYKSVRTLLQNGAHPFVGQSFTKWNGTLRFLVEVFYCNVNICTLRTIYWIVFTCAERTISVYFREGPLRGLTDDFIFQCAHSLSKADRAYLKTVNANTCIVQPLTVMSRNSLRRHYGLHIHKFVHSVFMPKPLRRIILLEDIIDEFCKKLKWND